MKYANGTTDTVRLLGVDTPEVHVETDPAEWEGVPVSQAGRDCLSQEGDDASNYMKSQIAGEQITLKFDAKADRRGSYGRLLAYVVEDSTNLNYQLIVKGHARVYDSTFEQSDRFYAAESDAQTSLVGAWRCRTVETATPTATSTPTPTPSDGGGSGGELTVDSVHEDAEGNDHDNLNDEYVTFKNTGDSTLDLDGWTVEDEADHSYTFSDVTVEPGETVTLYTGSGDDSDTEVYWGSGSAVWNNSGDTVYVTDSSGETVIEHSYE